jgi:hypothetical protein
LAIVIVMLVLHPGRLMWQARRLDKAGSGENVTRRSDKAGPGESGTLLATNE